MPEIESNAEINNVPAAAKEAPVKEPKPAKAPKAKKEKMDPEVKDKLEKKLAFLKRRQRVFDLEEKARVDSYASKGVMVSPKNVDKYGKEIAELEAMLK